MDRAKARDLSGYFERHHIIPLCLDGADDESNLVRLTPEEHFVAHLLLMKMYPDHWGLIGAVMRMSKNGGTSRLYGWLRRRFSRIRKRQAFSAETREKMRLAKLGKKRGPHSEETIAKMKATKTGRKYSEEHRAAIAKAHLGKKHPHSQKTKNKIRSALLKVMPDVRQRDCYQTDAYRQKQSDIMLRIWAKRNAQYGTTIGG